VQGLLPAALSSLPLLRPSFGALACASAVFTVGFSLYALAAAPRLLRRRPHAKGPEPTPPVTILKPIKGLDREMEENLSGFLEQDYPRYQVVFCLQDADDPARPLLERLKAAHPQVEVDIVVSRGRIGYNPKINNLSNSTPFIRHDLLMISDSDVRVEPDFLRRVVRPLEDHRVALVTCFYQSQRASGAGAILESLSINAHFLPQALAAAAGGMRFAMGAVMLVRRAAFDRIGGFSALSHHLADDFLLGHLLQAQGWRIAVADVVVASVPDEWSIPEHIHHLVRWARTIRICHPSGYLGSGILYGFPLLLLDILLFGPSPWKVQLLLLSALARAALVARLHMAWLGNREILRQLPLLPVSDCIQFAAWLGGFRSHRVHWRGETYALRANGRLEPLGGPAEGLAAAL
jgi:ceramide glucosyltransferase